jgi:hypothetical protein
MGALGIQLPLASTPFVEQQSDPWVPVLGCASGVHCSGFVWFDEFEMNWIHHQLQQHTKNKRTNVKNKSHENWKPVAGV